MESPNTGIKDTISTRMVMKCAVSAVVPRLVTIHMNEK